LTLALAMNPQVLAHYLSTSVPAFASLPWPLLMAAVAALTPQRFTVGELLLRQVSWVDRWTGAL
jgi:hypothetical protein